ncbi:MAG: type II toxin-antitoxin system RelE/ParE family toxin [Candidatus Margulisbacteria bacterium]|jgi:plasmid stabilization system protein ParE|nr:type II toxin-antitoxin system RelE/ParE family toxin [Candidatus Margulisiibacteriota bacterium]
MNRLIWTEDARFSFGEILQYIAEQSGQGLADKVYAKIIRKVDLLTVFPFKGKVSAELKSVGITHIYELVEAPWKIYYRVKTRQVVIMLVLDSRRNLEEVLIDKIINKKD